jgi:hypothetical protein
MHFALLISQSMFCMKRGQSTGQEITLSIKPYRAKRSNAVLQLKQAACPICPASQRAKLSGACVARAGGMHHAYFENGGGWCVYDDWVLALRMLRRASGGKVQRALLIDLDVHQARPGSCHAHPLLLLVNLFARPSLLCCSAAPPMLLTRLGWKAHVAGQHASGRAIVAPRHALHRGCSMPMLS